MQVKGLIRKFNKSGGKNMKKIVGIASILFLLDQVFKYLFLEMMDFGQTILIIPQFFSFTLVKNTGVAFSLFAGSQIPIIMLSILIMIALYLFWIPKQKLTTWNRISYGCLYGGILGNLIDRIFRTGVIDYLDFNLFGYDAPIFNLADICVVLGAFILFITMWKEEKK